MSVRITLLGFKVVGKGGMYGDNELAMHRQRRMNHMGSKHSFGGMMTFHMIRDTEKDNQIYPTYPHGELLESTFDCLDSTYRTAVTHIHLKGTHILLV